MSDTCYLGFWMWVCLGATCIWFISILSCVSVWSLGSEVSYRKLPNEYILAYCTLPCYWSNKIQKTKSSLGFNKSSSTYHSKASVCTYRKWLISYFRFSCADFFPKLREWNYNFILNGSRLYWHIFSLLFEIWSQVRQFSKRVWYLQHCIKPSGSSSGL